MKDKRIYNAWDKIQPSHAAKARMLDSVLKQANSHRRTQSQHMVAFTTMISHWLRSKRNFHSKMISKLK
jgi:hypothetical protein